MVGRKIPLFLATVSIIHAFSNLHFDSKSLSNLHFDSTRVDRKNAPHIWEMSTKIRGVETPLNGLQSKITGTMCTTQTALSRRSIMHKCTTIAALISLAIPSETKAADGLDRKQDAVDSVGEAVRELGTKLPGLGPRDVTYPPWFIGRWQMTRTLASVEMLGDGKGAGVDRLPPAGQTLTYDVRFLPDGRGGAVADRGFAAEARARAEGRPGARAAWSAGNPNALALAWPDGAAAEFRVTKRSSAAGDDRLGPDWSELTRVTVVPPPAAGSPVTPEVRAEWVRAPPPRPRHFRHCRNAPTTCVLCLRVCVGEKRK
jgi:hypothetical protein